MTTNGINTKRLDCMQDIWIRKPVNEFKDLLINDGNCEYCKRFITDKRKAYILEDNVIFIKHLFCSRVCMNSFIKLYRQYKWQLQQFNDKNNLNLVSTSWNEKNTTAKRISVLNNFNLTMTEYNIIVNQGCAICGIKLPIELHHIIPKSKGGSNSIDNFMPLCSNHHRLISRLKNSVDLTRQYHLEFEDNNKLNSKELNCLIDTHNDSFKELCIKIISNYKIPKELKIKIKEYVKEHFDYVI